MANEPQVIDGARSVGQIEAEIAKAKEAESRQRALGRLSAPVKVKRAAGKPSYPTKFVSAHPNHLLLLDIPQTLPDGSIKHNRFNVRFENGMLDLTQRKWEFTLAKVRETLCASPNYGKAYWDFDEQEAAFAQASREQTLNVIRAAKAKLSTEERAALAAELNADDFDLPKQD